MHVTRLPCQDRRQGMSSGHLMKNASKHLESDQEEASSPRTDVEATVNFLWQVNDPASRLVSLIGACRERGREEMSRATTLAIVGMVVTLLPSSAAVAGTHPQGDRRDRIEDVRDRLEDRADRREDVRDRREDRRDALRDGGLRDRIEDRVDQREDRRDQREDRRDRREDRRDRRR